MMDARARLAELLDRAEEILAEYNPVKMLLRDKREPDRERKEKIARSIARVIRRRLSKQAERLYFQLRMQYPQRGQKAIGDVIDFDVLFEDDPEEAQELIAMILAGAQGGMELAKLQTRLQLDYGLTNTEAATWARRYSYELIKDLDSTTRDIIKSAVTDFIKDPDYTMSDLFDLLEPQFGRVRAERIAVTEVTRAYSQGQRMARETLKEQFPGVTVVDRWYTNNDDLVCPLCGPLDGEERTQGEAFYQPEDAYQDGYPPRHPNCVLPGNVVYSPGGISAASKSFYVGRCIEILCDSGSKISITPNHPILTSRGWIAAAEIKEGDNLFNAGEAKREVSSVNPYNQDRPSKIEEIFSTLVKSFSVGSAVVPTSPEDFHGDGKFIEGDIEVVNINRLLLGNSKPAGDKTFRQKYFSGRYTEKVFLSKHGLLNDLSVGLFLSLHRFMRGLNLSLPGFLIHTRPFDLFGLGLSSRDNTITDEPVMEGIPTNTGAVREYILRNAGKVFTDPVIAVREFNFTGHVYDLQNDLYGFYICNNIITHNCRCWINTTTRL